MSPLVVSIIESILQLDGNVAPAIRAAYESGDLLSLSQLEYSPGTEDNFRIAQTNYRLSKLFSKLEYVPGISPESKRLKCIQKYLAAEQHLRNTRITREAEDVADYAYAYILKPLIENFDIYDALGQCCHGPGRTATRSSQQSHPLQKFLYPCSISSSLLRALKRLEREDLRQANAWLAAILDDYEKDTSVLIIHEANLMDTVPKKATVDRGVAYEADLNMYIQKGLEAWLCKNVLEPCKLFIRRLHKPMESVAKKLNFSFQEGEARRLGLTISNVTQPEYHGMLVQEIPELILTEDKQSASDLIPASLVLRLFQGELGNWLMVSSHRRTSFKLLGADVEIPLRKYATMGNATTFPVETLVFYSLLRARYEMTGRSYGILSVFGDDVVTDIEARDEILWIETNFHFKTNWDKTFLSGPFRESCGSESHSGLDIWPLRLKRDPTIHFEALKKHFEKWKIDGLSKSEDPIAFIKRMNKHRPNQKLMEAINDSITLCNGLLTLGIHDDRWMRVRRAVINSAPGQIRPFLQGLQRMSYYQGKPTWISHKFSVVEKTTPGRFLKDPQGPEGERYGIFQDGRCRFRPTMDAVLLLSHHGGTLSASRTSRKSWHFELTSF